METAAYYSLADQAFSLIFFFFFFFFFLNRFFLLLLPRSDFFLVVFFLPSETASPHETREPPFSAFGEELARRLVNLGQH